MIPNIVFGAGIDRADVNSYRPVKQSHGSLSTIEHMHRMLHEGKLYKIPYFKTVAASSWATLWLYSPSTELACHTRFQFTSDNSGIIEIFKGVVTSSSQWQSIIPIQSNGLSTNASQAIVYSGGTPTTSSAQLLLVQCVGSGGKATSGGTGDTESEIILTPNSTYAIKFTCTSTESDVSFSIYYYEED